MCAKLSAAATSDGRLGNGAGAPDHVAEELRIQGTRHQQVVATVGARAEGHIRAARDGAKGLV